jgi:tetratricopeptide (TPR) repeat protein
MKVAKVAPLAILVACGAVAMSISAVAQQPVAAPARSLNLSREERTAIQALQTAAAGVDRVAQDAALAAARSVASSADARYAVASSQLQIARSRGDAAQMAAAVDAMVASGVAAPSELPALYANQAARAYYANEYQRAERLLARAIEIQPNDPVLIAERAQLKSQIGAALRRGGRANEAQAEYRDAVTMLQRAIELRLASGNIPPESWFKRGLALAHDNSLAPQAAALARGLVNAYPTAGNWRDVLLSYRQANASDAALDLDIRRLIRVAGGLAGERDHVELAELLGRAGLAAEMKSVLDEGVSRGALSSTEPLVRQLLAESTRRASAERAGLARLRTAALAAATGTPARSAGDAFFGSGQYVEAAELYRAALQKGGEDPNLVNTRLGAALALAGQRVEAETVFRAVTGPRADLAGFWLAWLARRAA